MSIWNWAYIVIIKIQRKTTTSTSVDFIIIIIIIIRPSFHIHNKSEDILIRAFLHSANCDYVLLASGTPACDNILDADQIIQIKQHTWRHVCTMWLRSTFLFFSIFFSFAVVVKDKTSTQNITLLLCPLLLFSIHSFQWWRFNDASNLFQVGLVYIYSYSYELHRVEWIAAH